MEINYALIGKRIRETRKQRGLSAEELAEIAAPQEDDQQRRSRQHEQQAQRIAVVLQSFEK